MTDPLPACWSCGSERVGTTNDLIVCGDCGAGPEPERIWQTRALGPALDVVLEAVREGLPQDVTQAGLNQDVTTIWADEDGNAMDAPVGVALLDTQCTDLDNCVQRMFIAMLIALREAHSPTDTPSGSGAEGEERGNG